MPATIRPATDAEIPEVAELITRSEQASGGERVLTADELRADWDGATTSLSTDTRVAEVDGTVVGCAWVWHREPDERLDRAYVFGEVAPEHRRVGIGGALLAWGIERAAERLRADGSGVRKVVRTDVDDRRIDALALYESKGLRPARWFEVLRLDLADAPQLPTVDGIDVVSWPTERSDEIRRVRNSAFVDHWGSTDETPESWSARVASPGTRTDLSVVAVDIEDQSIVGYALTARYPWDDEVTGRADAWVDHLGVAASHRGRGIASALIAAATTLFRAEGCTHAVLDVDADSPTGASRLYRSLGFEAVERTVTYELEIE